mgnify:CR=1 FL=1
MLFEDEEDAANFCTYHGLTKTDEGITKGSSFIEPKTAMGRVKSSLIEAKRGPFKLSDIVNLTPHQRDGRSNMSNFVIELIACRIPERRTHRRACECAASHCYTTSTS